MLFTAMKKTITFGEIKKHTKDVATPYGFKYVATEEDRKKTGTLSSTLALLSAFRPRFTEVSLGNPSIILRIVDGTELEMELHRFNLNSTLSVLLLGCKYIRE